VRLELEGVTAAYGDVIALRDVNLTVPDGSVVALLGANGAGKTTLLSVAAGLLAPSSGRVLLDRTDLTGQSPDALVRRGLCLVTEGRAVFPGMTVADNLRMFSQGTAEADAIARAVDAFPRLGERLSQLAGTLSGGEQQMLAMARTYTRHSAVVLLDEVSLGLAPIIVDEIFAFLARLADEGTSLLIVEQYVSKALTLADTVYLLARGHIAFAGEPEEILGTDIFARYLGAEVGSWPGQLQG
jgi:branched-chain amino acid transport system ATP-binding protein